MTLEVGAADHLSFDGRKLIVPPGFTVTEAVPGGGDVTLGSGLRGFGAKCDGQNLSDAAMTAASNVVTSATGLFQPADVGKLAFVGGAGQVQTTGTTNTNTTLSGLASLAGIYPGATVTGPDIPASTTVVAIPSSTTVTLSQAATGSHVGGAYSFSKTLATTITGYTSATQVTVADNASFTVSAQNVKWGTDDSAAWTAAVAEFNLGGGQALYLNGGMSLCQGGYTLSASGTVYGNGKSFASGGTGQVLNGTVVLLTGGGSSDLFTVSAQNVTFRDFGIDGNYAAQTAVRRNVVVTGFQFNAVRMEINAASGDGLAFTSGTSTGARCDNVDMRLNQAHGITIAANTTDMDFYSVNIGTSGLSGVNIAAPGNNWDLLHTWGNGVWKVIADQAGIRSQGAVAACRFANSYFETNNGYGVYTLNSGVVGWSFSNCTFWKNGISGAYMFTAKNINFAACIVYDNGQTTNNAGIINDTGTDWCVAGCNFYDDQGASKTQTFGYIEQNTVLNSTVTGNSMRAANHKTGSNTITGLVNQPVALFTGTTHTSTLVDGITSTAGLVPGMTVSGSGVAAGTVIASVNSTTAITLSAATTTSVVGTTLTTNAMAYFNQI